MLESQHFSASLLQARWLPMSQVLPSSVKVMAAGHRHVGDGRVRALNVFTDSRLDEPDPRALVMHGLRSTWRALIVDKNYSARRTSTRAVGRICAP